MLRLLDAGANLKTEWEFQFETRGFRFGREHKYVTQSEDAALADCVVRIVPNKHEPASEADQMGSMYVLLRNSPSESRDHAIYVARTVADRISFQQGEFRLFSGLISCKRIAESSDEEVEIGDTPYSVEVRLVEVDPIETFTGERITRNPVVPQHGALISEFNAAKRDRNPAMQFLGYFRILESVYCSSQVRASLTKSLLGSLGLRRIFESLAVSDSFDATIPVIVDVRHKCAHLKLSSGFGYVPADASAHLEIRPYLPLLEALAYHTIMGVDVSRDGA